MSVVAHTHTGVTFQRPSEPPVVTTPDNGLQNQWKHERQEIKRRQLVRKVQKVFEHERVFPSIRTRSDSHTGCKVPAAIPLTQTALIITRDRTYRLESEFPAPQDLGPNDVVIRNRAVGLNHIDWKSVDYNFCLPDLPWVTGRELAGVVERIGSGVTKVKTGDAVWTSTYYKDRRAGCFQEFVVEPQHTVFLIPTCLDFTSAASLGVGALTAGMCLWRWLGVPMQLEKNPLANPPVPVTKPKETLLVWGGSTVTGQFAIQIAAQADLDVIAVCSQSTAALVSSLGATSVVTYTCKTDADIVQEIVSLAGDRMTKAIDLVGAKTAKLVLQVIEACGRPVEFAPLAFMSSKDSVPSNAIVHTVEMKQFVLDKQSEKYGAQLNDMIERKVLKIPKLRVLQGGLGVVEEGLARLKAGDLVGEKLIVAVN